MIPYGKQTIDDDDIEAVVRVLRSDFLTTGPEVEAFEKEFADFVGARYAVAVNSGTAALHLAMRVAGIGPGHRVVTSPNTFVASANCAAYVGATPDFVDIDPVSYNLCPQALEENWKSDTKAVVAVDYAGQPANMPAIAKLARARGAIVIEDGCHGVGGGFEAEGKFWKIGGHPWADMTTFSFHPVKTMTTGEGGMLVTDNEEYARKARLLRSHGIQKDPDQMDRFGRNAEFEYGPWVYEMQDLGFNYRLTDLQCALGRSQLRKLPKFMRRRQEIFDHYDQAFRGISWLKTPSNNECRINTGDEDWPIGTVDVICSHVSWHLYTVLIDFDALGKSRSEVMAGLRGRGVGTQVLYIPVYLQPWYQHQYGYKPGKCARAESFYQRALSLPLYASMTDADVTHVVEGLAALSG